MQAISCQVLIWMYALSCQLLIPIIPKSSKFKRFVLLHICLLRQLVRTGLFHPCTKRYDNHHGAKAGGNITT